MMGWSRAGQTNHLFSQAKADQAVAEASRKAEHARDMEAAKQLAKEQKTAKKKQKKES